MKRLTSISIMIFILSLCSLMALGSYEKPIITAAGNDKDLIVTYDSGYDLHSSYVDLETNTTYDLLVDDYPRRDLLGVRVNGISNYVAYIFKEKVIIYNYKNQTRVSEINEPDLRRLGFSRDGSKLYTLDIQTSKLRTIEANTGNVTNEFNIDYSQTGYQYFGINIYKDELFIKVDSVLHIWSIEKQTEIRTIPIDSRAERLRLISNGDQLFYFIGKQSYIINYEDGTVTWNKEFVSFSNEDFSFTNDSKYIIFNSDYESIIYSFQDDKIIDFEFMPEKYRPISYSFITSNLDKALIIYKDALYCPDYGIEMPVEFYSPYLIDLKNKIEIISYPEGRVYPTKNPIISDDKKFILATGGSINGKKNHLRYSLDKKYLNRIYEESEPILYCDNSKFIAFLDSNKIKLYNVETNQFEREFETGMDTVTIAYYLPKDGGVLILRNKEEVKLFNYSDFSVLNSIDLNAHQLNNTFLKFDGEANLVTYKNSRIVKFNMFTSEVVENEIINIPAGFYIRDLTSDGNFALYMNSDYDVIHYNVESQNYKTKSIKSNLLGEHSTFLGIGFMGNYQSFWYLFVPNPINKTPTSFNYNIITESLSRGVGENIRFNQDNTYYTTYGGCGDGFGIGKVDDLLSSIETTTAITGGVYPNPASDFIKLDINASSLYSSIEIYDAYGKQVMSVIYTGEDIDISKLTAGVYFVKVGEWTHKFIKH